MNHFYKVNELVETAENVDKLKQVIIIINKDRIKLCKYGKYTKPVQIIYKYEGMEDKVLNTPDYLIKIPSTQDDCIQTVGTHFTVISVNAQEKKTYVGIDMASHNYYDCAIQVIRNPIQIKKLEEIEHEAYNVSEFEF